MSDLLSPRPLPDALRTAENLPTLPAVALEVLRLCREEDTTLDDLAEALSHDTALAARLLRFANSSLYNLGQEVTSLQRGSLILGMKTVQMMALSFSLASALPREGSTKGFDHPMFWRRSMACAVAGRTMANLAGTGTEDEAFLCGLLGEIGSLVLAQCMTEDYANVLEAAGDGWPTIADEARLLGFDRGDIGSALLSSWELPEKICAGVAYMHNPDALPAGASGEVRTLVHVMHVSALTVSLLTSDGKGDALAMIEDKASEYFGLLPDAVYSFITALEPGIRETSEMLSMPIPAGMTHEEILDEARHQMSNISQDLPTTILDLRDRPTLPHRVRLRADLELRDRLTGLSNHHAYARFFEEEVAARATGEQHPPLGLLLLRSDGDIELRATHGDETADQVLREVGSTIQKLVRQGDLPCRLGTRDFAVILSDASPMGLRALSARLRSGLDAVSIEVNGVPVSTTVIMAGACVAGATSRRDVRGLQDVVRHLLTRARRAGQGGIEIHDDVLDGRSHPHQGA